MKIVQKTGRFYTGIIMKNIGIFIFIGLLSVVFQPDGWVPNATMYEISQFAYNYALPSMIAFAGGSRIGGHEGGTLAVMALCGLLIGSPESGIFGAMLCGPVCGFLWKKGQKLLEDSQLAKMQMLVKNLTLGMTGGILAAVSYYLLTRVTGSVSSVLEYAVSFLIEHRCIAVLNVLIEPAKVFFFNNLLNHGAFVPLGMSQAEQAGKSLLFLLETNPGPGLGVILGLLICRREDGKRRAELMAVAVTEAIGGVHEVYFPLVLQNLRLLIPLICGGITGTVWFSIFQCGTAGVVSPGSVITILILSDPERMLATGGGILISAGVSCALTFLCIESQKHACIKNEKIVSEDQKQEKEAIINMDKVTEVPQSYRSEEEKTRNRMQEKQINYQNLHKIGFVCDGGMGSSAMGAALFRRSLAAHGIQGVEVKAYAADLIPENLDLIVCQKEFYQLNEEMQELNCHVISGFTAKEEYEALAGRILSENNMGN
nr:hypothetical protein [uncultured Mediterraneibacter sp.]